MALDYGWRRVSFQCQTAGGDQDISVPSGYGSTKVPKGVILVVSGTATVGSTATGARISMGFYDGTNVRHVSAMTKHNTSPGTTDSGVRYSNNRIIDICSTASEASVARASPVSFGTGKVTINWNTTPGTAWVGEAWFFFGDDMDCFVTSGNGSITSAPWKAHGLLTGLALGNDFTNDASAQEASFCFGFAGRLPSITQACTVWAAEDRNNPTALALKTRNDRCGVVAQVISTSGSEVGNVEVTAFNDDGWTVTNANSLHTMYLAFRVRGAELKVWCGAPLINTDTLGDTDITDAGFLPAVVFQASTFVSDYVMNSDEGRISIGCATDASEEGSVGMWADDGIGTGSNANARSKATNTFVDTHANTASDWIGNFKGFLMTGFTVEVTDASSADRVSALMMVENISRPAVSAPDFSGTGTVTIPGSGQIRVPAPDFSGSGTETIQGSGQVRSAAPDFSGSGTHVAETTGSGQVRSEAPDFSGSGTVTIQGSGQIRSEAPDFSGSATETIQGSGQVRSAAPDFSGSGTLTIQGSGQLRIEAPDFQGSGTETITGSGQIRAVTADFSGTGSHDSTITGSGQIRSAAPDFSGTGTVTIQGSGQIRTSAPDFSGSATETIQGSGQVRSAAPDFSGSGAETIQGSGQVRVESPDFSGSGSETIQGSGQIRAAAPDFLGSGFEIITGSGQVRVASPALLGSGSLLITGSGQVLVSAPDFSGAGLVIVNPIGTGSINSEAPSFLGVGTVTIIEVNIGCTEDFAASYSSLAPLLASHRLVSNLNGSYDGMSQLRGSIC